jgi:hypothetical protein
MHRFVFQEPDIGWHSENLHKPYNMNHPFIARQRTVTETCRSAQPPTAAASSSTGQNRVPQLTFYRLEFLNRFGFQVMYGAEQSIFRLIVE